jgi:hypothetical protein
LVICSGCNRLLPVLTSTSAFQTDEPYATCIKPSGRTTVPSSSLKVVSMNASTAALRAIEAPSGASTAIDKSRTIVNTERRADVARISASVLLLMPLTGISRAI